MQLDPDPFRAFEGWYADARAAEPDVPEAMVLATVDAQGQPSQRAVLLKGLSDQGLDFYTNLGSRKAHDLTGNPRASLHFHWKSKARQVSVRGQVVKLPRDADEAYFATRPRASQIGAWASRQSEVLPSRAELLARVAKEGLRFGLGAVPCPPFWGGFRLVPDRFEFWQGVDARLHDRIEFLLADGSWSQRRLYP